MDNNLLNQTAPQPVPTVPQPSVGGTVPPPPKQPANVVQAPADGGEQPPQSKKMILMLVGGLILVLVLIGGAYLYVSRSGTTQNQTQTVQQQDTLETELNQINVEDLESEFSTVEADLQNL